MSVAGPSSPVLLTGATGYVGGRLLTALEAGGYHVRCLVRRPEALQHRAGPRVEVVAGDVQDPASLDRALAGCDVAYYLVHSMGVGGGFEEADRRAATSFGQAARVAGVRRIIYLGGLDRAAPCRRTSRAARRSAACWPRPASRPSSSAPRSSSAPGACRSR